LFCRLAGCKTYDGEDGRVKAELGPVEGQVQYKWGDDTYLAWMIDN